MVVVVVVGREIRDEKSSWAGSVTQGQQRESSASDLFVMLIRQTPTSSAEFKGWRASLWL